MGCGGPATSQALENVCHPSTEVLRAGLPLESGRSTPRRGSVPRQHHPQMKLSRDGSCIAYTVDPGDGSERLQVYVHHIGSPGAGMRLPHLEGSVSIEWSRDGSHLYCTRADELGRPCRWTAVCEAAGSRMYWAHNGRSMVFAPWHGDRRAALPWLACADAAESSPLAHCSSLARDTPHSLHAPQTRVGAPAGSSAHRARVPL